MNQTKRKVMCFCGTLCLDVCSGKKNFTTLFQQSWNKDKVVMSPKKTFEFYSILSDLVFFWSRFRLDLVFWGLIAILISISRFQLDSVSISISSFWDGLGFGLVDRKKTWFSLDLDFVFLKLSQTMIPWSQKFAIDRKTQNLHLCLGLSWKR